LDVTRENETRSARVRVAVLIALMSVASPLAALSLGAEQVTSRLGQPLRLVVPLLGEGASSLEARCFRIVTAPRSDGIYVVTQGRIELQTNTAPPQLLVRGNQALDEPIVRISIEVGCDAPIRRDYTLLIDPPTTSAVETRPANQVPSTVAPPQAVLNQPDRPASPVTTSEPLPPPAATSAPRTRAPSDGRTKLSATAKSDTKRPTAPRTAIPGASKLRGSAGATQRDQLQVGASDASGGARIDEAALAALAVPRLRVSSDLALTNPANLPGTPTVDELQAAINKDRRERLFAAPIDSDIAPRLEADLVVAQRRLAELQLQLAAAGGAASPPTTAEPAAPASSKAAPAKTAPDADGWNRLTWLWLPGIALVIGLFAFLIRQRRAPKASPFDAQMSDANDELVDDARTIALDTTVGSTQNNKKGGVSASLTSHASESQVEATPPAPSLSPLPATSSTSAPSSTPTARASETRTPIIATRAEREASDRLNNPLFQLRDTESHVDVTELSQVTEEAQVYADLGRNDQAIELLRDHIDDQSGDRLSPAPWLMIFELYRKTSNRRGYDELAPLFRKRFNGRVPEWDNYGHELALDDGLEAFPHLVARIERDWGTGEARKFLEELLYDNRGGSRLGFSLAAYRDILLLLQVHEGLSTEPALGVTDWESRGADDTDGTPKWDLSLEMIEPPKLGELESFLNRPPPDRS
jgi:pilus assembly protein FimV